jgi:response regulator of citrate/malate metabolism
MKVVIIEDEEFAARRLERMIGEIDPGTQVVAKLESVGESVKWLKNNQQPDLIFMDIHLEDNLSFAIFSNVAISCPIVFTTATDEKSTILFRQKQLDYLLKPIVMDELKHVLSKYSLSQADNRQIVDASFFTDITKRNN